MIGIVKSPYLNASNEFINFAKEIRFDFSTEIIVIEVHTNRIEMSSNVLLRLMSRFHRNPFWQINLYTCV